MTVLHKIMNNSKLKLRLFEIYPVLSNAKAWLVIVVMAFQSDTRFIDQGGRPFYLCDIW